MQNKKRLAFIPLIALMGLAGCDVVAKSDNYDKDIVTYNNDASVSHAVYNNWVSIVEDSYHDGSMASDVLDTVLSQYAVSIFGRYNRIVDKIEGEPADITLKEAVNNAYSTSEDKTVVNTFISNHSSYWSTNKDGKRINDNGEVVDKAAAASDSEIARLKERWNIIEELIAEKMYNQISGGSYSDRGNFYESRFVESLTNSGKKVTATGSYNDGKIISPSVEPEQTFEKGLLNRAHYQDHFVYNETEDPNTTVRYVEDEIIPEIYNSLLVSQYLVDKKYNVLGSSYAREVNIFSITTKSQFPKQDDYLINSLINEINYYEPDAASRFETTLDDFKAYSNAWNGVLSEDTAKHNREAKILEDIHKLDKSLFDKKYEVDGDEKTAYYVGTEYGEMVKDYHSLDILYEPATPEEAQTKWKTVDSSILSDFTNSGAYVREIGKEIKKNNIAVKDNTQTGWFISNGGLTSLPESIRSRLFSFSVATAFKEDPVAQELSDRVYMDPLTGKWGYDASRDTSSYLARINNTYYLKNSSASQGSDPKNDILFYDTSSSTYYVIQVLNAVRSAKLDKNGGDEAYDSVKKEEIINAICKCVASTESYTTLAKKYFLEEMSLQYHDTVVYDYFKANYPELFED